jgi:hypothetical protein
LSKCPLLLPPGVPPLSARCGEGGGEGRRGGEGELSAREKSPKGGATTPTREGGEKEEEGSQSERSHKVRGEGGEEEEEEGKERGERPSPRVGKGVVVLVVDVEAVPVPRLVVVDAGAGAVALPFPIEAEDLMPQLRPGCRRVRVPRGSHRGGHPSRRS